MAYKKRGASSEVETAQVRNLGIGQIEPNFDFGNGLSNEVHIAKINKVANGIQTYNGLLTNADSVSSQIDIDEKDLSDFNSRLLNIIGSKFGYDSLEYEKAGGVRTSDIKRSKSVKNNTNQVTQ
jgi:hypothetical protein